MPHIRHRVPPGEDDVNAYHHDHYEDDVPQKNRTLLCTDTSAKENIAAPKTENGLTLAPTLAQYGKATTEDATALAAWQKALLQELTSHQTGESRLYTLKGEKAFYDHGDRILMASAQASQNDRMILAAVLTARTNNQGAIEVTGSPKFIEKTLGLIARHNVKVHLKNPDQQRLFDEIEKVHAQNTASIEHPTPATVSTLNTSSVSSPAPAKTRAQKAPHRLQLSAIEREALRVGITGKLTAAASAHYLHNPNHPESFFVTLQTRQGEQTYWGSELKQALQDAGHKPGDMVKLQYQEANTGAMEPLTWQTTVDVTHATAKNAWQVSSGVDHKLLVYNRTATFSAPALSPGTMPLAIPPRADVSPHDRAAKREPQATLTQREQTKPTLKHHP